MANKNKIYNNFQNIASIEINTSTKIMRLSLFIAIILFQVKLVIGQTSLSKIGLNNGKYKVGFRHYTTSDSTRTYNRIYDFTNQKIPRPIPISIWYPSEQNIVGKEQFKVLDYLEILKEEEEWEYLPNEQILNWFYYANTPENQDHLIEKTSAYAEIEFAKGQFPVVIYTPSYQASSIENFALAEY